MKSYVSDRIYIIPRPGTGAGIRQSRHWCARTTGVLGKAPVVQIGPRSAWQNPPGLERHRACWTYDVDSDEWFPFDNIEILGDSWVAWNNSPFTADTVYMSNLPSYTNARYNSKIDGWISSPKVSPTESAIDGYTIGHMPSIVGPHDKVLPAFDCRAFKVGTGPNKFVLTSGVHPDEPGHWMFEAAIDQIMLDDALGQSLRNKFTFYVYPNINPQGLYGGYCRVAPDINIDCNRIWFREMDSVVQRIYTPAWTTDASDLMGVIDFHTTPGADPSGARPVREVWASWTDSSQDLLLPWAEELESYGGFRRAAMPSTSISGFFGTIGSPRMAPTVELTHGTDAWIPEWKMFAVDALRALDAVV